MEKFYKRFLLMIVIPVIAAGFPFFVFASSENSKAYDWYFMPSANNESPVLCPEAEFVDSYDVISIGNSDEKELYLTFDAGYDNGYHTTILDTLRDKNVKAAFFVDGNFVKTNPELVKQIANDGHLVCNHSLNHPDMTKLTDFETYKKQIIKWNELVENLGITPNKYFRFPGGRFSNLALDYNKKLGITSVFWSFAYYDWDNEKQPSNSAALKKIYSRTHNGAVLLLHSTSKTNSEILPELIDGMRARGYSFKSLDDFKK